MLWETSSWFIAGWERKPPDGTRARACSQNGKSERERERVPLKSN